MRAFLALAARWERVERWNILGGFREVGLLWFDLVRLGGLWYCGRQSFGLLTGGGLDQDLFDELLIPISTQRAFLYIYIYIKKKSQFPLLPYLPVSSSSSNKQQKSSSS